MKKIAFLFLTIDNIHFPKLWEDFFDDNWENINIYCHPKNPENVTVPWLRNNIIPNLVDTGWGYIVNAYRELLKCAIKNKDNIKFITISESCVPIVRFHDLYKNLLMMENINKSYIKTMNISSYDWEARIKTQDNWSNMDITWKKHYARFCLSRQHVNILLKNEDKLDFFGKMHVGDEFFLSIINDDENIIDRAITFDNWDRTNKKVKVIKNQIKKLYKQNGSLDEIEKLKLLYQDIGRNPHSYSNVDNRDVVEAKKTDSFFWRKFPKESNIEKFTLYKKRNKDWKKITVVYPKRNHLTLDQLDKIPYYDENDNVINTIINERPEQYLSSDYIMPDMTVLELGARYGTVSCVINNKLENPRNHVAMEPDKSVIQALIKNRKTHNSKFTIINAIISKKPMSIILNDYATNVVDVTQESNEKRLSNVSSVQIKNHALKDIMKMLNLKFDTLVADCEGCICSFLEENEHYVKKYRMIILEQDLPNLCNYKAVNKKLISWNFKLTSPGFVSVWHRKIK